MDRRTDTTPWRIVMMGTGPFAVPTLRALVAAGHELAAVVTRPKRNVHGESAPNPMREAAEAIGLAILDPENVNAPDSIAALAALAPDLFVVADYGQILSAELLAVPRHAAINLHASLLPKYRGAAPVAWAIYHGETETGVTVIHMTPRIDAGPCIAQERLAIDPRETAGQLESRLAELGAALVCRAIEQMKSGKVEPIPQDKTQATRAPRLKKTDGEIRWDRPPQAVCDQIHAMQPWPKCFTHWHHEGRAPVRLTITRASVEPPEVDSQRIPLEARLWLAEKAHPSVLPGTVVAAGKETLLVATGESAPGQAGAVFVQEVQPAGKRVMSAGEFLRGHPVRAGDRFGPEKPT
ncbi:MAG: methionyl-tRNA formyltransferase [Planctomycetia bacterium]|nr:methionyl-tRNA formyltransferase [Planctomycetia bacterium]